MGEWEGRQILDILQQFDLNGDNMIDRTEMQKVLKALTMHEEDIDQLMAAADTNGDGCIDYEEFVEWLMPKKPSDVDNIEAVRSKFHGIVRGMPQKCSTRGCPMLVTGVCPHYCCVKCRNQQGKKGHGPACSQSRAPERDVLSAVGDSNGGLKEDKGPLLELESDEHMADLAQIFPGHVEIHETARRGIKLHQIDSVISYVKARCKRWHDTSSHSKTYGQTLSLEMVNLYHLNTWLIKPSTKANNCAFVELVASGDQTPSWFVSHWWGEVHIDFFKAVELHVTIRSLPRATCFWVCAYANRQHSLASEVVADPRNTSFYKAIQSCKGILLVLDDKRPFSGPATPFTRVWCAFEESVALDQEDNLELVLDIACCKDGIPQILTHGLTQDEINLESSKYEGAGAKAKSLRERSFPLEVIEAGLVLKLENAQASVEADRRHILNCIAGVDDLDAEVAEEHPAYDRVNKQLRAIFAAAAWRQAVEKDMVKALSLPSVLADDKTLRSLTMSFMLCPSMGGQQMAMLGKGLPQNLRFLDIDFSKCEHIGDAGIAAFASGLPSSLEKLDLSFRKCWQVTDQGPATLGANLPMSLVELNLVFAQCGGIQDSGLAALGLGFVRLQERIQRLQLDFGDCAGLGDCGLCSLASSLPRTLKFLKLVLRGCTSLTSLGFAALGLGLPKQLEEFSLGATFTRVTDSGLAGLAWAVAANRSLRKLCLGLGAVPLISDAGVAALTETLPAGLESLHLGFDQCTNVGSPGIAAAMRQISCLSMLRELSMCLNSTSVDDSGAAAFVGGMPESVQEVQVKTENGWHFWGASKLSPSTLAAFNSFASLKTWQPSVEPAQPAQPATPIPKREIEIALPPPFGLNETLVAALPLVPTEEVNYVRSLSSDEAVIDVPTPCKNLEADTVDDRHIYFDITGLKPMTRMSLCFSGVHNSHYIGVNQVILSDRHGKISYTVLTKGAAAVCSDRGWWAVAGESHELLLDLGEECQITLLGLFCANGNATPKQLRITEA